MPRRPTGNPRGRPRGSGVLGEQTRLTVRIPSELYDRLEAFAEGRSFSRGTPQLAGCVRDALEHYLACPYKRQTKNVSLLVDDNKRQTEIITEVGSPGLRAVEDEKRQTIIVPPLPVHPVEPQHISQPINEQAETEDVLKEGLAESSDYKRQTEKSTSAAAVPWFDETKHHLGKLCHAGHEWGTTGQSLRANNKAGYCLACNAALNVEHKRAARRRQA